MEQELTITIPTTFSEIPLGQFVRFNGNLQEYLGLTDEELEYIPLSSLEEALNKLRKITASPRELGNQFELGDQKFIYIIPIEHWTLQEWSFYNSLDKESLSTLPEMIALHTRPALKKYKLSFREMRKKGFKNSVKEFRLRKGEYYPAPWNAVEYYERVELFRECMPMDIAYSISLFYGFLNYELMKQFAVDIISEIK